MEKKSSNRLYCHFFHSKNSCKKAERCDFIHGEKLPDCPNGDRCPIKIPHIYVEIPKKPKRTEEKKVELKNAGIREDNMSSHLETKKIIEEAEKRAPFNNILNSFKLTLSSWDTPIQVDERIPQQFLQKKIDMEKNQPQIADFGKKQFSNNIEAQTFLNHFWVLKEDMDIFKPVYSQFFQRQELDLLFIVDCTGSMASWIEAVKLEIEGIVSAVCNQHVGSVVRVGFVGYRDYGDTQRYEIADFTEDIQQFESFLRKVKTIPGYDVPEDVAGGFLNANKQSWRSKARHAVLLADAPAHGDIYHEERYPWYDRYPRGDPDGVSLKDEVKSLVKKNVQLTALKITSETDLMFKMLKSYVKEVNGYDMEIGKLGDKAQGFTQYIAESASKTLTMSYTKNTKENPNDAFFKALAICKESDTASSKNTKFYQRFARDVEVEETKESVDPSQRGETLSMVVKEVNCFPAQISGKEVPAICHTYFIVAENDEPINWRCPLVQNSSIHTSIKIDSIPFAEGAMRYAFYAEDVKLKQNLVAKLSKKRYNSLEVEWKMIVKDLESQFICQHLVNQFNDRISEHVNSTANLKTFVHCFLYEIKDPDNKTSKYFPLYSAENYIEGKYEKFNNNAGWCNMSYDEPGLLSQALSHFTYQATLGYLMVVDLQGVGAYLTDPQIHCLDQHRFGAGNLGYQGIFKFFLTHACNRYCKALNLLHPTTTSKPPVSLPFFESEIEAPLNLNKQVFCICDLCKEYFTTTSGFIYLKRSNGQEKYCPPCDTKRANSMKQATCKGCNEKFKSSQYWFLMKRTDFPELCSQCRKLRRERLRAELDSS